VAWLDSDHPDHQASSKALDACAANDELAVSSVSFAELAAGGRTREALEQDLQGFRKVELDFDAAFHAGRAFSQYRPRKQERLSVLPDFFIRAQAAALGVPHLTNDRRGLTLFPEVDFLFPQ